jgi:hypothetical protein
MPQQRRGKSSGGQRKRASSDSKLPDVIYAQASPRSVGGVSLFDAGATVSAHTVPSFYSENDIVQAAVQRLRESGFQILQVSAATINIAGPAAAYEAAFGTQLVTEERPVIKPGGREDTGTFIEAPETDQPGLIETRGTHFGDVIEGVAIERPVYWMESAFAPPKKYWHLDVPGDVSLGLNADRAHRGGTTGKGVKVVMTDSGWFRHKFFVERGYRASPVVLGPGAANPNADESGHGTGESANVFSAAPDVDFTMVKLNFANATAGFNAAVALAPHIISNSWGSDQELGPLGAADTALAAAIATAVASGIIVVFSAGNGHWGFPGQHPDVISAGGVFMDNDGSTRASDYSSGFASKIYAARNVPDVSGLVGMQPGASYIMLPVEPGDDIDSTRAGGTWPGTAQTPRDETGANDGWGAFSGTSAAAPQIAGVCALIRSACARLTPPEVKDILVKSARDVTAGNNHPRFNHPATPGTDLATGAGLVDAHKAVLMAKLRCRTIRPPVIGPPVVGPPVVGPPVITPPVLPPVVIGPPVVQPPVIVGPPVVGPPVVRPPVVGPPVINPPVVGAQPAGEEAATDLTEEEVAALEDMIVEGDDPDA